MRKYGNMFRAFDCPGDATMNRVRIADIKMMCGNTAVHADMVTWHPEEPLEMAALQLVNTLFGVPQLSILLSDALPPYVEMIAFFTRYWNENADVLVTGKFIPSKPLANYPLQRVSKNGKSIIGVYDSYIIEMKEENEEIHILNGQLTESVVIRNTQNFGAYEVKTYNCQGTIVNQEKKSFSKGVLEIAIPPCGILTAKKSV